MDIDNVLVRPVRWSNFHGTRTGSVSKYCSLQLAEPHDIEAHLRQSCDALRAVLRHCRATGQSLRLLGAGWSMSSVLGLADVMVDTAELCAMLTVPAGWILDAEASGTPVFIQGGTHISSINWRLAEQGLALRTSGAGDGHRIAGCIATGTHGAAINIGAVHDTVLGLHLVVGPNRSLYLQPSRPVLNERITSMLAATTGMPVEHVCDDQLFRAAVVGLGSTGVVHGVVLDCVPLYALRKRVDHAPYTRLETVLSESIATLRDQFHHVEAIVDPYDDKCFVVRMEKVGIEEAPELPPGPSAAIPELATDTMSLIAALNDYLGGASLLNSVMSCAVSRVCAERYPEGEVCLPPGHMFGPTTLPAGSGTATEIAVCFSNGMTALGIVRDVLRRLHRQGTLLLGAIAIRVTGQGDALLGLNARTDSGLTMFIELPSIQCADADVIFRSVWSALDGSGIPYTCHWGMFGNNSRERLVRYYGSAVNKWEESRHTLLEDEKMRRCLESEVLAEVGLR